MNLGNLKLTVAYDGTRFFGWQKNNEGPSIEQELENVLTQVLQKKITLQAASRTDRGVHASGQVVNFFTEKTKLHLPLLQRSVNSLLPQEIVIKEIESLPLSFHPTLDALEKEYHYFLSLGPFQYPQHRLFAWHVTAPLDLVTMKEAANYLQGHHNFKAFCNQRENLVYPSKKRTINHISCELLEDHRLKISIRGDDFLYKMVRNLVGTLVYVGNQKISVNQVPEILHSKKRTLAGVTAPAHGLFLMKIFYPEEIEDRI